MRKAFAFLSLGFASLAVACGGSSGDSSTTSSTSTTATGTGGSGTGGQGAGGEGTGGQGTGGQGTGGQHAGGAGGGTTTSTNPAVQPKCQGDAKTYVDKTVYQLPGDETWTKDNVYVIHGWVETLGHKLTIEAGTKVCFGPGPDLSDGIGSIRVGAQGALDVSGTASEHVVFVPVDDHDSYSGVEYDSDATGGLVQYLDSFAGGDSCCGGIIQSLGTNQKGAKLDWRNVHVYANKRVGIVNLLGGFTPETTITFHKFGPIQNGDAPPDYYFGYPILRMKPETLVTLSPTTLTVDDDVPAAVKYIAVDNPAGMQNDKDITFPKVAANLTYLMRDFILGGNAASPNTWTIAAGVRVAIGSTNNVSIGDFGNTLSNVKWVGTAAEPIVFTSASVHETGKPPAAGDWSGIVFYRDNYDPKVSTIDYVKFEYGGSLPKDTMNSCVGQVQAELLFDNGSSFVEGPSITNSTFESSAGGAIRSNGSGDKPGTLTTNYADPQYKNTFNGFAAANPATDPAVCP